MASTDVDDGPVPPQTGEGPQADSPLELTPPDWKESLRRTAKQFKDDRASLTAAGMAFYWFLGIFPALLAAVGVLGLLNAGSSATDAINRGVRSALPGDAAKVLTDAVTKAGAQSDGAAVVATLVGVALALYSASSGMAAMQSGLNVAYDVPQDRTFLMKRLNALLLLVVAALLGGLATALMVFGQPLGDAIGDNLPLGTGTVFVVAWTVVRWGLAVAALCVLFAAFYYLGPNRESPKWTWVSAGGVLAMAIWVAASLGFSFYVSSFGSYAETYGSLAGVVVLLLWLYLTALAVMIGGELNAELERQSALKAGQLGSGRSGRSGPSGRSGSARPAPAANRTPSGNGGSDGMREWAERMRRLRNEQGDASTAGGGSRALR